MTLIALHNSMVRGLRWTVLAAGALLLTATMTVAQSSDSSAVPAHVDDAMLERTAAAYVKVRDISIKTEQAMDRTNDSAKKVEALFAELKNQIGLRRLRLRRLKFVREQFFLAAVAQNIKRLVRFLSQPTNPVLPATT